MPRKAKYRLCQICGCGSRTQFCPQCRRDGSVAELQAELKPGDIARRLGIPLAMRAVAVDIFRAVTSLRTAWGIKRK